MYYNIMIIQRFTIPNALGRDQMSHFLFFIAYTLSLVGDIEVTRLYEMIQPYS